MIRIFTVLAVAAFTAETQAGLSDEPGVSPAIHQYIDAEVSVVGWIDITQIDTAELQTFLEQTLGQGMNQPEPVEAVRAALVQLDVKRIYWLSDFSPPHLPQSFLLETEKTDAAKLLISTLAGGSGAHVESHDNVVMAAQDPELLRRLTTIKGKPSPELLRAIVRCEADPQALVVRTPTLVMTTAVNVLPNLIGDNPRQMAQAAEALVSVQTIAISGELPPSQVKLVIETRSEKNAAQLTQFVNTVAKDQLSESASPVELHADGKLAVWESKSLSDTKLAMEALRIAMDSSGPQDTVNSLKQIGLAQHNFHDVWSHFTPQSLVDLNGKRLLSWRVLILPYIDESPLYNRFRLDEPWDSPHNMALVKEMPAIYGSKDSRDLAKAGLTRFVAPLTNDSVMGRKGPAVKIRDIIDGTSNTLLVVHATPEQAVIWTKPDDVVVDPDEPLKPFVTEDSDGFFGCLCDGSVRKIPATIDVGIFKALLSMSGREVIPEY